MSPIAAVLVVFPAPPLFVAIVITVPLSFISWLSFWYKASTASSNTRAFGFPAFPASTTSFEALLRESVVNIAFRFLTGNSITPKLYELYNFLSLMIALVKTSINSLFFFATFVW